MTGPFTIHDGSGEVVAGSDVLDQAVRDEADRLGGRVTDADGSTVYPTAEGEPEA